jgi:hypothetical protein
MSNFYFKLENLRVNIYKERPSHKGQAALMTGGEKYLSGNL